VARSVISVNFWTGVSRADMPRFALPNGAGRYGVQIFWSYDDGDVEDNQTAETLVVTFVRRPKVVRADRATADRYFARRLPTAVS